MPRPHESLSRNPRRDTFEHVGLLFAGGSEVVQVLEVEPVFGRGAEVFAEAQRGGGGDALTALDDGSDPAVGQAGILGKPVLGDAQIAERFLERLTGMGIVKEWGGFHGGFSGSLRFPGLQSFESRGEDDPIYSFRQ